MSFEPNEVEFLRRLVADMPAARPASVKIAAYFEAEHGIGVTIGRRIEYRTRDFEKVAALLKNEGLDLGRLPPDTLRSATSGAGSLSEKHGTTRPHANSVLVKAASGACSLNGVELSLPRGGYHVLLYQDAVQIDCDVVMVIENLETFRYIGDYEWIDYRNRSVLAVFRGDNLFRTDDALKVIEAKSVIWYFGDFDPAGLGMAVALANRCGLERLIHPPEDWLKRECAARGLVKLYGDQVGQYKRSLDGEKRDDVAALWSVMRQCQAGIPQERMRWLIRN